MIFCATVDDVGYDGYSTVTDLARLLDFYNGHGVRATFFVVPRCGRRSLGSRRGYVALLRRALEQGHEIAQHGLVHDRFEFGIPPEMVLALPHEGPARARLAKERRAIMADLSVRKIRRRLAEGRAILQEAIGHPVYGFRSPCLSVCDNLFTALAAERYAWDSSLYLQPGGWDILNGVTATPAAIAKPVYKKLQRPGTLPILPLTTEYTWYLSGSRYEATLHLALADLEACARARIPFVPLAHVSPILRGGRGGLGLKLYETLFTAARAAAGEAVFCPLSEAVGS